MPTNKITVTSEDEYVPDTEELALFWSKVFSLKQGRLPNALVRDLRRFYKSTDVAASGKGEYLYMIEIKRSNEKSDDRGLKYIIGGELKIQKISISSCIKSVRNDTGSVDVTALGDMPKDGEMIELDGNLIGIE